MAPFPSTESPTLEGAKLSSLCFLTVETEWPAVSSPAFQCWPIVTLSPRAVRWRQSLLTLFLLAYFATATGKNGDNPVLWFRLWLRIKARVCCTLSQHATTEPHPQLYLCLSETRWVQLSYQSRKQMCRAGPTLIHRIMSAVLASGCQAGS